MIERKIEIKLKDIIIDLFLIFSITIAIGILSIIVSVSISFFNNDPIRDYMIREEVFWVGFVMIYIVYYIIRRRFIIPWTIIQIIFNLLITMFFLYTIIKYIDPEFGPKTYILLLIPIVILINKHILDIIMLNLKTKNYKINTSSSSN